MDKKRAKSNKDVKRGVLNRRDGIFKKGHAIDKYYPGIEVAITVLYNRAVASSYETKPGLIKWLSERQPNPESISGPNQYDTVADRNSEPKAETGVLNGWGSSSAGASTPTSIQSCGSTASSLSEEWSIYSSWSPSEIARDLGNGWTPVSINGPSELDLESATALEPGRSETGMQTELWGAISESDGSSEGANTPQPTRKDYRKTLLSLAAELKW